jgi:hypothetical protein
VILEDIESKVIGDALIIAKRFAARGLVACDGKRNAANLDAFGGTEERHECRIVPDRSRDVPLIEERRREAGVVRSDTGCESTWAGADNGDIPRLGIVSHVTGRSG